MSQIITINPERWHRVQAEHRAQAGDQDYRTWLYDQHQITAQGWTQTRSDDGQVTLAYRVEFENGRAAMLFMLKY